jgi:hypothetical protein
MVRGDVKSLTFDSENGREGIQKLRGRDSKIAWRGFKNSGEGIQEQRGGDSRAAWRGFKPTWRGFKNPKQRDR